MARRKQAATANKDAAQAVAATVYEHEVHTFEDKPQAGFLNHMSGMGWEMFHACPRGPRQVDVYFRRPADPTFGTEDGDE